MALESAKKKIGGEVGTKNCSGICDLQWPRRIYRQSDVCCFVFESVMPA